MSFTVSMQCYKSEDFHAAATNAHQFLHGPANKNQTWLRVKDSEHNDEVVMLISDAQLQQVADAVNTRLAEIAARQREQENVTA